MRYINGEYWVLKGFHLAIILLAIVFSTSAFGQCSTAAWTSVSGSPAAVGPPASKKYEQDCALTVNAATAPSYVTTDTPIDETTFSARFYMLTEALNIATGVNDYVTVLRARNNSTAEFELRLRSTGSVIHLVSYYRDNGSLVKHPTELELQDVWQAIEITWSAGSVDGAFEIKIDDIPQIADMAVANGSSVITDLDFGIVELTSATGALVLDAIELRRAGNSGLLTVTELENISTRADVRTVNEIVIGGFVIEGDTDKCVVVRARGPSVGVPDGEIRLSDPWLVLKSGADNVDINYDWVDSPEAGIMINLGLQPPFDEEAAIYVCLPPGPYTALVRGEGGVTGIGIVEVFDADEGTSYLENISTRAPVDIGNKAAIGGFIVSGDQPKQVLIRGRGPSVGVDDGVVRLPDPWVRLFLPEGDTVDNLDWRDTQESEILATGLAPPDDTEAAILITLQPGLYTAIVRGEGGTSGVGIVEVYDLSGVSIAPQ
ncbi:hypothetical protein ACFL07_01755 [Pseudomonadota bacterium]